MPYEEPRASDVSIRQESFVYASVSVVLDDRVRAAEAEVAWLCCPPKPGERAPAGCHVDVAAHDAVVSKSFSSVRTGKPVG